MLNSVRLKQVVMLAAVLVGGFLVSACSVETQVFGLQLGPSAVQQAAAVRNDAPVRLKRKPKRVSRVLVASKRQVTVRKTVRTTVVKGKVSRAAIKARSQAPKKKLSKRPIKKSIKKVLKTKKSLKRKSITKPVQSRQATKTKVKSRAKPVKLRKRPTSKTRAKKILVAALIPNPSAPRAVAIKQPMRKAMKAAGNKGTYRFVVVTKNQTLSHIATRSKITVMRLRTINKLPTTVIHPGQRLLVPTR